jgi:hypothetical protein
MCDDTLGAIDVFPNQTVPQGDRKIKLVTFFATLEANPATFPRNSPDAFSA